jgi:hypothetical protein
MERQFSLAKAGEHRDLLLVLLHQIQIPGGGVLAVNKLFPQVVVVHQ